MSLKLYPSWKNCAVFSNSIFLQVLRIIPQIINKKLYLQLFVFLEFLVTFLFPVSEASVWSLFNFLTDCFLGLLYSCNLKTSFSFISGLVPLFLGFSFVECG